MVSIDGYDDLCITFMNSCVLLLVVFLVLYLSVVGGVGCVDMCGLVVDLGQLCFGSAC